MHVNVRATGQEMVVSYICCMLFVLPLSPLTSQSATDWLLNWRQLFQHVCLGLETDWSIIQGERVWKREKEEMGERQLKASAIERE